MVQAEVITIIQSYIELLKVSGMKIDRAFLFGSYASNNAKEDSDIDVLLVSDVFETDDDIILSKPWLIASKLDHRIEPLTVSNHRFESNDASPILEAVRQESIEIKI